MTSNTISQAYDLNCRVYNILQMMAHELYLKSRDKLAGRLYKQFNNHRNYMQKVLYAQK